MEGNQRLTDTSTTQHSTTEEAKNRTELLRGNQIPLELLDELDTIKTKKEGTAEELNSSHVQSQA